MSTWSFILLCTRTRNYGTVFVLWQFHQPIVVVADAECIKVCIALTESVYIQFIGTLIDEV